MRHKERGHDADDDVDAAAWRYELVPLLEQPQVDLTVSVKAHLHRFRLINQIITVIARYPACFFFLYLAFLGVGASVFFVRASLGRVLAVVASILGLPSLFLCFSMLRYDLVVVIVKTYDVWFFGVTSTLVSIAAGTLFHDARCLLLFVSWLSFFMSIFVDANLFAIRNIWITGAISAVCYIVLAGLMSAGFVDDLHHVNIIHTNGHVLPMNAVVRDGLTTMTVLIVRNLFRRYHHAIKKQQITVGASVLVIRCVTFRCRLQLRKVAIEAPTAIARHSTGREATCVPHEPTKRPATTTVRLRFAPFLGPLDARNSLIPIAWFWKLDPTSQSWWTQWGQRAVRILGGICFFIPNAVLVASLLAPASLDRTFMIICTAVTTSISVILVTLCLATAHRQLLFALVTSFDFLYIAFQGVVIHIALADLCRWKPEITLALLSDLTWSTWMMSWDAVPPPARKRLGVTSLFAAYIGTGLIVAINVTACIIVIVIPPGAIHDRPVLRFDVLGTRFEFFVLTGYLSCAATIISWAIRIMWRLWRATESELVVLDGPVFFEKPLRSRDASKPASNRTPMPPDGVVSPNAIVPESQ